jgi:signal transduction histidine kinase
MFCYLPGGLVRVRAEPGLLAVEDTGLGLPEEDLARAFERFYLYDRHGQGRRLGTGLGLAIVKELAEAMGGSVEVRSEVGKGTSFLVRLPAPEGGRPEPRREPQEARR